MLIVEEVESARRGHGVEGHVESQLLNVRHAVYSFFFVSVEFRVDYVIGSASEGFEECMLECLRSRWLTQYPRNPTAVQIQAGVETKSYPLTLATSLKERKEEI